MYQLIDFKFGPRASALFPESRPTARGLRKLLAKLNTQLNLGLPDWFFGYGVDGKCLGTRPTILISENIAPDSLRITAIGPQACELLVQKGWLIQAALMRASDEPVASKDRAGAHAISPISGPSMSYYMYRMAVGNTLPKSFWWRESQTAGSGWSDQAHMRLAHVIAESIYLQASDWIRAGDTIEGEIGDWLESRLGDQNPEGNHQLCREFKLRVGLKVTSIGHGNSCVRSTGSRGLKILLRDVEFQTRCDIRGPWAVGANRIEGFGQIRKSTRSRLVPQGTVSADTEESVQ